MQLAATALNEQMCGARRIDSEDSWPSVGAAADDSRRVEVAQPDAGVAFRAPPSTLAEAMRKREAAEKEAGEEAARRMREDGPLQFE